MTYRCDLSPNAPYHALTQSDCRKVLQEALMAYKNSVNVKSMQEKLDAILATLKEKDTPNS